MFHHVQSLLHAGGFQPRAHEGRLYVAMLLSSECLARTILRKDPRSWSIFPDPLESSIVDADMFHFWVRDGIRWFHIAKKTEGLIAKLLRADQVVPIRLNYRDSAIFKFFLIVKAACPPYPDVTSGEGGENSKAVLSKK